MLGCVVMYAIYFVICSFLFYAIFPKTTGQRKRRAATNGAVVAFMATAVMRFAVASRPWVSFGLLLFACVNVAYSFVVWRNIAAGEGGSLRVSSAICATILILCVCWLPVAYSLDCFVRGLGGNRFAMAFGSWALAIALTVLLAAVWSTFCRQRQYSRGAVVVRWIAIALAAIMTISSVVSAAVAVPQSKSVKAADIPSVFATDGEAFEELKEFFGRIFGNSEEAALAETDDGSVAADVADDESVVAVAEVDDESVVAEVAKESDDESAVAEVAEESDEAEREPIVVENAWFDFYNLSIQEDGEGENDFNFGPKPAGETASEIAKEHRERLRIDPALGAADIAWADALLGTRYLGEFYESCKHDWAKTINAAKERFMEDHEAYDEVLDAFMKMQAKAKVYMQDGEIMEDQMYMNPYTVDGYPDVIVLKTPNHKGKFLVYEYTIKGTGVVKVAYRIDCGFQPTDVQKVMNITPATEAPEKKPDTPKPPTSGEVTPVPKAPTPTPKPTVTPTPTPKPGEGSDPEKDPSKAPKENTERNDDSGTGPSTNSGKGSTKSSEASESQKASDGGSVKDYERRVEQNSSANAGGGSSGGSSGSGGSGQKAGGESNKPSQSVPKAKQDNNGNTGNGGSSIDKPTAKSEAAVSADTNQSVDAPGSADGFIGVPD